MRLIKSSIVGIGIGLAGFTVGMGLANADVEWWDPFTWTAATSTPTDNAFNSFFDSLLPTSSTLGGDLAGVGGQLGTDIPAGSDLLGTTVAYLGTSVGDGLGLAGADTAGNGTDLGDTTGGLVTFLGDFLNPSAWGL